MTPTVAEALRAAASELAVISDSPRLDVELLMADALGVSRSDLLLRHGGMDVPEGFARRVLRRLGHEPVAYILGQQDFYGRSFRVTPDVLIPRGDSETLIDAALVACPAPARVLDCGTGSGALLLTLLAEAPEATGVGIDRSAGALRVARLNAERLGLAGRARLLEADWTKPDWTEGLGQFDLIVANPPYVEEDAPLSPSVRDHEPAGALFAGPDGLDDYRRLIPRLPGLLADGGVAVVEIGWRQADAVSSIARSCGFAATLHMDLADLPRALVLEIGLGKACDRR